MIDVSISIVASNEKDVLNKCLHSIKNTVKGGLKYELIVVENASTDGTWEMLRSEFPDVAVIRNDTRKSFCQNHNMGIRKSTGRYVLILNSDVFFLDGFLEELVRTIEQDKKIGAVMGKLLHGYPEDHGNTIDSTGVRIFRNRRTVDRGQGEKDECQYDTVQSIFSPSGAAMLCRREMLEDIKMYGQYFDETFYAYKEELDLCWRARLFGWDMVYTPKAEAYHLRGWGKTTKRQNIPRFVRRHSFKNRYLMMIKNDHTANILRDIFPILWHEVLSLVYVVFREPHLFLAWGQVFALLPFTLRKRFEIMKKASVGAKEMGKWFV
jgi:GT2 family glycosyltransferase